MAQPGRIHPESDPPTTQPHKLFAKRSLLEGSSTKSIRFAEEASLRQSGNASEHCVRPTIEPPAEKQHSHQLQLPPELLCRKSQEASDKPDLHSLKWPDQHLVSGLHITSASSGLLPHPAPIEASNTGGAVQNDFCKHPQKSSWWPSARTLSLNDAWRPYWNSLCVVAAVLTGFTAPFTLAFEGSDDFNSHTWTSLEYWLVAVFSVDILLTFFTQYDDPDSGIPVTSLPRIALNYARGTLVLDLLVTLPWDKVVLAGLAMEPGSSKPALLVGLLRLLALGRLHRVASFVAMIEYRMLLPQAALILLRNNLYVLCSCHVAGATWLKERREAACLPACLPACCLPAADQGTLKHSFTALTTTASQTKRMKFIRLMGWLTAGMVFYLVARLEHFRPDSWVGRNYQRFEGIPVSGRYIYSLYFAMAAFTGLGDNDFYIASVPEAVVMLVYLLFNLLLGAYILGTVTMLLTKGDKRMKLFRDRVMNLRSYGVINTLPQRLMTAMEAHVELHFQSEQASDEQVLAIFPQTIRRRVLRHLYIKPIKECHLFAGCKPKYLDAVLAAGRVELFMPQEQIIADGDIVNEIWVLLEGEVEVCRGGTAPAHLRYGNKPASSTRDGMTKALMSRNRSKSTAGREQEQQGDAQGKGGGSRDQADMLHSFARQSMERGSVGNVSRNSSLARSSSMNGSECGSDHGSVGTEGSGGHDQSRVAAWGQANNDSAGSLYTRLAPGAAFGETSFFTELPSQESVWSSSVIKVLVLNRTAYQELLTTFPQQTRKVLQNLEVHNDELVTNMLLGSLTASKNMSEEVAQALHLLAIRDVGPSELTAGVLMEMRGLLKPHQRPMLDDMGKVKDALAKYVRKVDQEIVYEFLNNCSAGDEAAVRAALSGGMSPNAADYDKRTGLMLACHEGHAGLVRMLLEAGADPQLKDSFGGTAMWECVKNSRDGIIEILLEFGGSLGMEGFLVSSHLSQGVCDGDLVQVSRMIRAGANLNVPDYSGMTPLHVAVLSGNLPAVQLLVNEGAAKVDYKDTLGFTPYEEAVRLKNQPIADFLRAITEKAISDAADLVRNMDFLNFCSSGNESMVRQMLKAGQDPDTADYDVRTGLMLACHEGHEAIVRLLLVNGADPMRKDNFGNTAMWEAVLNKRHAIIDLMLEFGGGLGMQGVALSATMSRLIMEQDLPVLHSLLKAKADPDTEDYVCQAPLHVAALLGNLQAVRLLVEDANACVDPVDLHGRTPLDCARTRNHWQVVEYLEPLTQAAAQGQIKNRNNSCAPPACSLLLGQPRVIIPPKPASVPHPRDCPSQPPGLPDIPCASPASLTSADQASPFSLATRDTKLVLSPKPGGAAHPSLPPKHDPDSGFMLAPTLVTSFTSTTPSQLRKHPLSPQPGPCKPSTMSSFTSSITSAFTSITSRHWNAECDPRVPVPTSTSTSLHAALGTGQLPSKFKPSVDLTPRNPSCTSPLSPFLGPGSFVLSPFVASTSRGPASVTAVATGQGRQVPGKVTSKASFTAAGNGGGGANMAAMLRMRRSLAMEMGPGATGAAVDSQSLGSRTEGELSGFEYWGGPASPPPAPTALMTEQHGMRQRVQDLVPHRASGGSGNGASTPRLHRVPGTGGGRQDAGPSAATISGAGQWHALPGGLAMPPVLEVAGSSEEGEGSRDPSRRPAKGARNPLTDPLSQLNNGDEPED